MSKTFNRVVELNGEFRTINGIKVQCYQAIGPSDSDNEFISICAGTTIPTDALAGWSKGCTFIKTDGSAGSSVYINEGTSASCDFNPLSSPSHVVKYGGTFTTAGGDANESISVSGVVATDIVAVTVKTAGATPRSIVSAAAGTNAIAVVMSGDPSTDHVLQYVVFRAA